MQRSLTSITLRPRTETGIQSLRLSTAKRLPSVAHSHDCFMALTGSAGYLLACRLLKVDRRCFWFLGAEGARNDYCPRVG
jgi:hypothetical protein